MRRFNAEAAVHFLVQVINFYEANFGRQAVINDEKQIIDLKALVVVLRFVQNQLPGRPGSTAAIKCDPYGGIQSMSGQIIPHRLAGAGAYFQHGLYPFFRSHGAQKLQVESGAAPLTLSQRSFQNPPRSILMLSATWAKP